MICENCGAEVREGVPFCTECGRPMQTGKRAKKPKVEKPDKLKKAKAEELPERGVELLPEAEEPKPKKKKSKWKWILALVIVFALLIGAAYAYIAFPAFKMNRALGKGNAEGYAKAAELYADGVDGSFLQTKLAERACMDRMSMPADDYLSDEITYDDASAFYGVFGNDSDANKLAARAKALMKDVEAKHAVEVELGKGDAAFEAGDYAKAMELYAQIDESSPGYETAQKRMADSREKFVDSVLSEVEEHVKKGEYVKALHALDDALAILPDEERLTSRRDAFYEEYEDLKHEQAEAEEKEKEEKADEESKKDEKDDSEADPAESPEPTKRPNRDTKY